MSVPKLGVRPGDLDRVKKKMTPDLYARPIADLFHEAAEFALHEAQSAASDLGGIPGSLTAEVTTAGGRVVSGHPGALPMEFGRRAGAKFPPPDALGRYGEFTFPLARAIAERGVKGRFFFRKARAALARSEFPRLIEKAGKQIGERWAQR